MGYDLSKSPCLTRSLQLETRQNFLGVRDGTDFNLRLSFEYVGRMYCINISVVLNKVFAVGDGPFSSSMGYWVSSMVTKSPQTNLGNGKKYGF